MFRFFNKAIDYIGKKSPVLVHTPRADSLGNCAEEIFFGLMKAKREGKKILFLYPQNLVFRRLITPKEFFNKQASNSVRNSYDQNTGWLFRNLILRNFVANKKLFQVQSPYSVRNEFVWFICGWMLTFGIVLLGIGTRGPLKVFWNLLRLVWPKNSASVVFDLANMTPTIGRSSLWNPGGARHFSWEVVREQCWRQQFDEYVPPSLALGDCRRAEALRVQMGIPLDDWFVCLHVREGGFRKEVDNPRNASIQNYIEGIKAITDAGGWVVRLGDASMTPLPPMDGVIDNPHTRFKSELMDVYLLSQCRFFVGGASGPFEVGNLFGKPMVTVNLTVAGWSMALPVKKGDLSIMKHVFSRSCNRFLSISEILEEPFMWKGVDLVSDEYVMVENTPEEILEVIVEFLAKPEDYEYSGLQESFNIGRRDQIHRWFDQEELTSGKLIETFRIAARCDSSAATLGQKYLEQNWHVDNLQPG